MKPFWSPCLSGPEGHLKIYQGERSRDELCYPWPAQPFDRVRPVTSQEFAYVTLPR